MPASEADLEALLKAIRRAAPGRAWSRGVMLVREDAVEGQEEAEDEIVLTVRAADRPVPLTVVLYPETVEWDCDCAARADACAHAAAAIIALTQARKSGEQMPASDQPVAKIRYRFTRVPSGLRLERLIVSPAGEVAPLEEPAARLASPSSPGPRLALTEVDLEVEKMLSRGTATITRPESALRLFSALAPTPEIELEGRPVRVSGGKVLPVGRVEGDSQTLIFTIRRDQRVSEIPMDGVALVGDELRPLGEIGLTGGRLEKLPIRRTFERARFAELAAEVLPMFRGRFDIHVETEHLPSVGERLEPRIDLGIELGRDTVSAMPELVYGTPPRLRIQAGRPIYLEGTVPKRDHAAEQRLVERLRDEVNLVPGRRAEVRGADAAPFLRKLRSFQGDTGEALRLPRLRPRLQLDVDRFFVSFEIEEDAVDALSRGATGAEAEQVLRAYESGHDVAPLAGGGWAELPRDWLAEHGDHVALLLAMRDEEGRIRTAALPTLAKLCEALDHPPPPAVERLGPLFSSFEGVPPAELPRDLCAELRPYQKQGVDWLHFLRQAGLGGVLADDMGLGKTLQALCAIRGRTLIVCPTSVLPNWAAEIARFRPSLSVCRFHGPRRTLVSAADVTLTTYALLRQDESLSVARWDTVVLDEAQAIKNADSQTARAAFGLKADFCVALTGTPVENRLEELWSQMHFTNPGLLSGRSEFTARFARPIAEGDARAAAQLRDRIRPFVLRRLKREVARELPPRTEMVLHAELDDRERKLYDAIRLSTKQEVVQRLAAGGSTMAALEALLRLRQACCHSGLLPGQEAESSSKVDTLVEALSEVVDEGHKALVFSQWTSLLDRVEPHLADRGVPFLRLDGATRDRGLVVDTFQRAEGPPVLLISLKAGGTGLNLTAADHVFLLDPWWNPAVEDQAADRAHRIGQQRPVMVYRIVAMDTVEERILALQQHKRAIAAAALGEAAGAAALTREDLLALLE